MTTASLDHTILASSSYAALRHGGTPAPRARALLGLPPRVAAQLEKHFLARSGGGQDAMRPAFARHREHVAAVAAQGGFPSLSARSR